MCWKLGNCLKIWGEIQIESPSLNLKEHNEIYLVLTILANFCSYRFTLYSWLSFACHALGVDRFHNLVAVVAIRNFNGICTVHHIFIKLSWVAMWFTFFPSFLFTIIITYPDLQKTLEIDNMLGNIWSIHIR